MQQTTQQEHTLRSTDAMCVNESKLTHRWYHHLKYTLVGLMFGIIFVKAEIISWFRIQEMFRFQSFHMFGIIGSAVVVGMISVWIIRRFKSKPFTENRFIYKLNHSIRGIFMEP